MRMLYGLAAAATTAVAVLSAVCCWWDFIFVIYRCCCCCCTSSLRMNLKHQAITGCTQHPMAIIPGTAVYYYLY